MLYQMLPSSLRPTAGLDSATSWTATRAFRQLVLLAFFLAPHLCIDLNSIVDAQQEDHLNASHRRAASINCSQYQDVVKFGAITMHYTTVLDNGVGPNGYLSVRLVCPGKSWLGFGVSPDGLMVQSYAVIGQPGVTTGGTPNPGFYHLKGYSDTLVTVAGSNLQKSLTNAQIKKNSTHTIMTFSQRLVNGVGAAINGTGINTFIWASGASNQLAYHANRGSIALELRACQARPTSKKPTRKPTRKPSKLPTKLPTNKPPTRRPSPPSPTGTVDCSKYQQFYVIDKLSISFTSQFDNRGVGPNGWLRVKVIYRGLGWVGFGIASSNRGRMVPGQAIIGLPGDSSVGKYGMNGYTQSAVQLMPSSQQTLVNASIYQNGTHTVLRFSKRLLEHSLGNYEYDINGNGQNAFLLAYGYSNALSIHGYRTSFIYTLSACR